MLSHFNKHSIAAFADELRAIQAAQKEKGIKLDFFRGLWGAREVAYFLGLSVETARKQKAGLRKALIAQRIGAGLGSEKRAARKVLRWKPEAVIAYREGLFEQEATKRERRLAKVS